MGKLKTTPAIQEIIDHFTKQNSMEIKTIDCYVPVDVKNRLPAEKGWYYTIENGEQEMGYFNGEEFEETYRITKWFEKKEGVIVLTVEQAKGLFERVKQKVIAERNLAHANCLEAEKQAFNSIINIIDNEIKNLFHE